MLTHRLKGCTSPLEGCCTGTLVPRQEPKNLEQTPLTGTSRFLCRNRRAKAARQETLLRNASMVPSRRRF